MIDKRQYLDEPYWRRLASKHGIRIPRSDTKGFPAKKMMNRCGISREEFLDHFGCSPTEWRRRNPDWDLVGFVGLLLEIVEERAKSAA